MIEMMLHMENIVFDNETQCEKRSRRSHMRCSFLYRTFIGNSLDEMSERFVERVPEVDNPWPHRPNCFGRSQLRGTRRPETPT